MNDVRAAIGPVGLWSMELRSPRPETLDTVSALDELGYRALWVPGLDGRGVLDDVDHLLGAAPRAHVALGVVSIWSQTAATLTRRVADLDARHGPRTLVGLGISNAHAAANAGRDYGRPTASMSDYLDELDAATADGTAPIPHERRLLAALGPRMVDLAADRTSGWHPFLVPPAYCALERDRVGATSLIAPHQAVVLDTNPSRARAAARAGVGMFLGFPSYRSNLSRMGFTDADLDGGGSDRLIDALVAHGSLEDVERRVREHLDAGADHVALHVLSTDPGITGGPGGLAPVREWTELAQLLTSESAA